VTTELRANHTDYCKDIHNDDSAKALACFRMLCSLPWIIVVLAPFLFLSKMFQSWAVERFEAACYNCTLLVLAFLGVVSEGLGFVCIIYEKKYCGNAELRANHTDICKGIHNDDSARALQAFAWIFVILPVIAVMTTAFVYTSMLACQQIDVVTIVHHAYVVSGAWNSVFYVTN